MRRSDLSRAFDLGRARATAQLREKTASETWGAALTLLGEKYPDETFVLTRCLWCPEFTPAWEASRHNTLCSFECVAELRRTFGVLGLARELRPDLESDLPRTRTRWRGADVGALELRGRADGPRAGPDP